MQNQLQPGNSAGGFLMDSSKKEVKQPQDSTTENTAWQPSRRSLGPRAEAEASVKCLRNAVPMRGSLTSGQVPIRAISFFLRVTHRKEKGSQVNLTWHLCPGKSYQVTEKKPLTRQVTAYCQEMEGILEETPRPQANRKEWRN